MRSIIIFITVPNTFAELKKENGKKNVGLHNFFVGSIWVLIAHACVQLCTFIT